MKYAAHASPVRARDLRQYLEHQGYRVLKGRHEHMKLVHPDQRTILIPNNPSQAVSMPVLHSCASVLGTTVRELIAAVS